MSQKYEEDSLMITDIMKRSGWTRSMIDKFLGEPDRQERRYGGGVIKMFSRARVEAAELSPSFQVRAKKIMQSRPLRQEASRRSVATRRAAALLYVEGLKISVSDMSPEILRQRSIDSYNTLWSERGNYEKRATENDDADFLARIMVNFLRHELTNYEDELARLHGLVGAQDARFELRTRVLDAIGQKYPALAVECVDQQLRMFNLDK